MQVDNAIKDLEYIDNHLDEIGERNLPGYKTKIYLPHMIEEDNDSITISEKEYREIQNEIYSVIMDLEDLSRIMAKESETE